MRATTAAVLSCGVATIEGSELPRAVTKATTAAPKSARPMPEATWLARGPEKTSAAKEIATMTTTTPIAEPATRLDRNSRA
jgi:hypothetical protein